MAEQNDPQSLSSKNITFIYKSSRCYVTLELATKKSTFWHFKPLTSKNSTSNPQIPKNIKLTQ